MPKAYRESLKFSPDELEKISKKHSDTEKLSDKSKGERLKPNRNPSIKDAQKQDEEVERVENPNANIDTSFMDDMDMMGNGLESMELDLLEDGQNQNQSKPSVQADWINMAIASKLSPTRSPPIADMDMD